jgi:hypothetical protein
MTKDEIKEYRKILDKEFSDKDLEIETALSYITIGALGFFLTINEKFLKLVQAQFKGIIVLSLVLLFVAFVLILCRKSRTIRHAMKMMSFVDHMKANNPEDDAGLYKLWQDSHMELANIRKFVYFSLSLGIALQIAFLFLNIKIA